MEKSSDEEKAKLRARIEKMIQETKPDRIAEQAEKEKSATIIVTAIFTILGGMGGVYLYALYEPKNLYEDIYGLFIVFLIYVPIGAAVGFIIGLLLSYLVCRYWRRH